MPTAHQIASKRKASSPKAIKEKAERGDASGDERAFVRLGRSNTRILTGQEDLSEWDDEELRRGFKKDKHGQFKGRPPKIIPKALHDELVRRTMSKAQELLRDNLEAAVEVLTEIAGDPDCEAKDRLRAAGMIMDRVMGREPQKIEVGGEVPPWQVAIQAGIVSINGEALLGSDEAESGDEPLD